jgi:hypothetical protein
MKLLKWIEYRPSHMPGFVRACVVSVVAGTRIEFSYAYNAHNDRRSIARLRRSMRRFHPGLGEEFEGVTL